MSNQMLVLVTVPDDIAPEEVEMAVRRGVLDDIYGSDVEMLPEPYVIATGSVADGFALTGPFCDAGDAIKEAEVWAADQDWTVMPLLPYEGRPETQVAEAIAGIKAPQHDPDWED